MALLTYILLLYFLNYNLANNCVINNTAEYITWEKELLKDLRCDYSPYHAPSENTVVNVTYGLRAFNFNSDNDVMTMQTFMRMKWDDERLKWDPEKHHGINETDVSNFYLWTPLFRISNSEDYNLYFESYTYYSYKLKSTGEVTSTQSMVQKTLCSVVLTNWPYDVQECIYDFAPSAFPTWSRGKYSVNFDFIMMEPDSAEWYIYDHKHETNNRTKNNVKLTLYLMREAVGLSAIVVYPAFILTVLSILSLCLDVRRKVRFGIVCFSLLGHYYFLAELAHDIPKESDFAPTLLLYYRGSVVLTIIIFLLTLILDDVCKLKSIPNSYIKTINDFVYWNKYRSYLVFPRWDFDDATVDNKSSNEDWVKFANIANSFFIFVIVFTYICLYGTNIPKQSHYDKHYDKRYFD